jgi:4-hydroxy-4-methyl-2-oxoglutarate aldolase
MDDQMLSLAERLQRCYTGAVFDVLRAHGHRKCVLPYAIRPIHPEWRCAGPAFTVSGHPQEVDEHQSVLEWTGVLSQAPTGHVLVCQPHDHTLAHMGELSSEALHLKGVRGYIVDGGCRDSDFILRLGFPVFCRYLTPDDIVGRWLPEALGSDIEIGGVRVRTGDYVVADRDGVVVIPQEIVEEVTREAEEVMKTESLVRKAIRQGVDPQEAYLKYGKF